MWLRKSKEKPVAKPKQLKKNQYEDLGRIVASVYETGYLDAAKTYKMSFIKGLFSGLGGVIGATLLLALIIWILTLLDDVPLIGRLFENLENTINSR